MSNPVPKSPNLGLRQHSPKVSPASASGVAPPFSSDLNFASSTGPTPAGTAGFGGQRRIRPMKYLLVVGGVCSSLGKGVTTSSIGALLRSAGYHVSAIKIDPYINIDAGLMSPFEHGEVYVLDDGGEVDLDLGNYERWIGLKLGRDHNLTTGKVYNNLIRNEREGNFLGKTVQVVPHFTGFVQNHIKRVALIPTDSDDARPDICLIELGGTVGDIESAPFIEALRQLRFSLPPEDFCVALLTYLPCMGGQQKTKPTQHSAKALMSLGMLADFIFCRSSAPLHEDAKIKLSQLVGVKPKYIFSAHDVRNLYEIPSLFDRQHVVEAVLHKFNLAPTRYETPAMPLGKNSLFPEAPTPSKARDGSVDSAAGDNNNSSSSSGHISGGGSASDLPQLNLSFPTTSDWDLFANRLNNPKKVVKIAFVGKYVSGGSDSYFSVMQAFEHCCIALQVKLDILMLDPTALELGSNRFAEDQESAKRAREAITKMDGIFVPGGFGLRAFAGKCEAAYLARTSKVPFFGVCYGFQAAIVDFARKELGLTDANSEETDTEKKSQNHVIRYMPDIDRATMGANMRLGGKAAFISEPKPVEGYEAMCAAKPSLTEPSLLKRIYGGVDAVVERHRHRYEFNRKYLERMQKAGMRFTAASDPEYGEEVRIEALELPVEDHPHFLACQYHPEFLSSSFDPSPPFLSFVAAAAKMPLPASLSRPTSRRYKPAAATSSPAKAE